MSNHFNVRGQYQDHYYLDKVWMTIPGLDMNGQSKFFPGYMPGEAGFTLKYTRGNLGRTSFSFPGSIFTAGVPGGGGYSYNQNNNIWYIQGAFGGITYTREEWITFDGSPYLASSWTTTTIYDLEVYFEGATLTQEGYITGNQTISTQILLGGTDVGLYGYGPDLYTPKYIFANRKESHTLAQGAAGGGQGVERYFGMYSTPLGDNFDWVGFDSYSPDIPNWVNPDQRENAGFDYTSSHFEAVHQHSGAIYGAVHRPVIYWGYKRAEMQTLVGGWTNYNPVNGTSSWTTGQNCVVTRTFPYGTGGGIVGNPNNGWWHCWMTAASQVATCECWPNFWCQVIHFPASPHRLPNRTPPLPTGPSPGPGSSNTTASQLSCGECGPCSVTSKPYLVGRTNNLGGNTSGTLTHIDSDDQGGHAQDVWGDGTYIYLANHLAGLLSYSADVSGNLTHIDTVTTPGCSAIGVWGDGTYIYSAWHNCGIRSYSVDGSGNLTFIDSDDQGDDARAIWGDGTFIYLAYGHVTYSDPPYIGGIRSYSVDGSGNLTHIDSDDQGEYAYGVWGDGNFIYVVNNTGICSYSVDGSGNLTHIDSLDATYPSGVWGDGNFIYVSDLLAGLHSYSVDVSGNLTHIDTIGGELYAAGYRTIDVWGDGTYIYVAHAELGIRSYSVDGSGNLTHIDSHDQGDLAVSIWGDDNFIYLASYTGGLLSYRNNNWRGVPSTVKLCSTTVYPVSSETCAVSIYIYAPIKQEEYRVGQIVFWAGIDSDGAIVSLSDPRYTDYVNDTVISENIVTVPTSLKEVTPGPVANQFNTYDIRPSGVSRTDSDLVNLRNEMKNPSVNHANELKMWHLKERIGTLEFNPVTQKFKNIQMQSYQFTTLSRTLTAANYDESDYSMLYCPSDGRKAYRPLEREDGPGSGILTHIDTDYQEWGTINGVWGDGNFTYTTNLSDGLHSYTVAGSGYFTHLDRDRPVAGMATGVWGDGTYIYVTDDTLGLHSYSVDGSGNLTRLDTIDPSGDAKAVWGDGTYIYLANGTGGLHSLSANGSGILTHIDSDDQGDDAVSVWGDGTYIYLANGTGGLHSYSVNGSGILTNIDSDDQGDDARHVWGDGTYIYLANGAGGLHSYSVNGSGILTHIDSDDQGDVATGVWGDGIFIYLANDTGGLHSYSVNGSGILTHIHSDDQGGNAVKVWGDGNYVYVASTSALSYSVAGSQYIGWANQGSGYPADSDLCYEVEWRTVSPTLTGYGHLRSKPVPGGLNRLPRYIRTTNTRPPTGHYNSYDQGQGKIVIDRELVRPRDRLPVAGGTRALNHRDHQVRRYDLYSTQNQPMYRPNRGYVFRRSARQQLAVLGNAYNITRMMYPATNTHTVTADRLVYEYNERAWDIADFAHFTALSAVEFAKFLNATDGFSTISPLSSPNPMLQLIGLCTYQGSPTAANGAFYCAAIARGNVPTWCHVVTGIGRPYVAAISPDLPQLGPFENFVVCTTGCNLVLPYITYRADD